MKEIAGGKRDWDSKAMTNAIPETCHNPLSDTAGNKVCAKQRQIRRLRGFGVSQYPRCLFCGSLCADAEAKAIHERFCEGRP
jgi:hypothetical protein